MYIYYEKLFSFQDSYSIYKPPDFQAQIFTALMDNNITLSSNRLQKNNAYGKKAINHNHQYVRLY
jgi:hypothetical protein